MSRGIMAIAALFIVALAGCAPTIPRWRQDARNVLDAASRNGAEKTFPAEFGSAREVFGRCETLLQEGSVEDAEACYRFALLKGQLLEQHLAAEKVRLTEEAQRRTQEEKLALERQRVLLEEQRRAEKERAAVAVVRPKVDKPKLQSKERQPSTSYTVKRGETLPQIAALPDVYGDYRLWPLLYRSNRDQISDPRHIWPGQVLRIPRNLSRDDITEARRYAQEKPL